MRTRPAFAAALLVLLLSGCEKSQTGSPVGPGQGTTAKPTPSKALPKVEPDKIEGIKHVKYDAGAHVAASARVDYRESPPFGGSHDQIWAPCNGVVYPEAVRSENLVHSLEHGAVWIAYNPERLDQAAVNLLAGKVVNKPYTVMSPYPGLDHPVSLQAWGYQLKVDDPTDPRVDQFIISLRQNQQTTPEPNATCDLVPDAGFDPQNPPPFDPSPPGPDAVPDDAKPRTSSIPGG